MSSSDPVCNPHACVSCLLEDFCFRRFTTTIDSIPWPLLTGRWRNLVICWSHSSHRFMWSSSVYYRFVLSQGRRRSGLTELAEPVYQILTASLYGYSLTATNVNYVSVSTSSLAYKLHAYSIYTVIIRSLMLVITHTSTSNIVWTLNIVKGDMWLVRVVIILKHCSLFSFSFERCPFVLIDSGHSLTV
jgi:hypothetical protein